MKKTEKSLLLSATNLVSFFACLIFVGFILFAFKISISFFNLMIAILFTMFFSVWYASKIKANFSIQIFSILLSIILVSFGTLASSYIYDTSYDGQSYHQEAVILMDFGWNPLYTRLTDEATTNMEKWLNHYPKGNWIIATSIYKITHNIESGKVLSILSGIIAYAFVLFGIYKTKLNFALKALVSALLSFNPVFVYQSLSYYMDGILVSIFLSLAFIGFRIVTQKEKFLFWPFLFLSVVFINLKLTSIVFWIILVTCIFLYIWFSDKMRFALWFAKASSLILVISTLFIGFNPFVTNFVGFGNPLYPAMGKGAYDYVSTNTPENYWSLPAPLRLLSSIYSESSLVRGKGKFSKIKLPFVVHSNELAPFRETNAKIGGFGPLFGLAFSISLLGLIYMFKNYKVVAISLAILGLGAIVPTSSVARYVPFVWWFPSIVCFSLLINRTIFAKVFASLIITILLINSLLVSFIYYPYNIALSAELESQLDDLSKSTNSMISVNVGQFGSTKIKLAKHSIPFKEVYPNEECVQPKQFLVNSVARICEAKE